MGELIARMAEKLISAEEGEKTANDFKTTEISVWSNLLDLSDLLAAVVMDR